LLAELHLFLLKALDEKKSDAVRAKKTFLSLVALKNLHPRRNLRSLLPSDVLLHTKK
jgi:hypothetical protein